MSVSKKDFICSVPFTSIEIHDKKRFLCCASWLKKYLPEESNIYTAWNSSEANEIRNSILDGSYRFCESSQCPFLNQIEKLGNVGRVHPLYHNSDLPLRLKSKIESYLKGEEITPDVIQFSFDRTCNLECPSCRVSMFVANSKKIKEVKLTIDEIEKFYSKNVRTLYITGSGDPFISVGFRDFLRNFDPSKYPQLKNIHLHTNATKWDKKMWDSMSKIHKYVKSCEISIDAGTKETYETKTRLGGNWDELIQNLKFIYTIPTLQKVKTSFVVQQSNYKEMKIFYDLMFSIFKEKTNVFYGKITNWGTYSDEEFKKHQIWSTAHPEHKDFLIELNETLPKQYAYTNLQEFLVTKKVKIL